ncbi:AAA family ATPase [Streptomyces mirabilis]|uniref:AAA family ATPase n=1 Tax=Streptomyces mirabilis TaxID=68239 RepID=UPI003570D5A0
MLGRIAEASAVARLLRDTASGRGGALFVVGEPGLGRTTLLRRILTLPVRPRRPRETTRPAHGRLARARRERCHPHPGPFGHRGFLRYSATGSR